MRLGRERMMKRLQGMMIIALLCGCQSSLAVVDFSRYEPILERRPFSSAVAAEAEAAPAVVTVEAPPAFVQHLRMVAITESPAGIRVGFVNIREKPPKTYFLYVGDSEDGILMADADYDRERALLRKDGEQYWLSMGEATASPAPGGNAPVRAAGVSGIQRAHVSSNSDADQDTQARALSYAERRRRRIEEMRRRAEESRKLSDEEVEKRLREYQMKLIREGKTPLPIPITEEMDAQLVKEGILPPLE